MKKYLNGIEIIKNQLMCIMTEKQKKQCVIICIMIFIGSLFEMLGVSAIIPFIQAVLEPTQLINTWYLVPIFTLFDIKTNMEIILSVGIFLIGIYIFKNSYLLLSTYVQTRFRLRLQKDLSVLMLRTYMRRPYTFFLNTNSGDILRGLTSDVNGVYVILENCFKILTEGITVILITVLLIMVDPFMAMGIISIAGACFLFITLGLRKKMNSMGIHQREILAQQNKYAYQAANGIKEITVMQRNEEFIKKYEDAYEIKRGIDVTYYFSLAIPERIIEGICIAGIIGIVCIRIVLGVEVETFVPKLATFAVAAFRILPSISRLTGYFTGIQFYQSTLNAAHDNIKSAREYEEDLSKYILSQDINNRMQCPRKFERELYIKNITWRYDNSAHNILSDLSISISRGESVAFIGASGAGKTTLADIILGLLQPLEGSVYMDDIDIFTMKKNWAKIIGYVPQMIFLLDDTIRENITFGLNNYTIDDQKVWDALEKARLRSFVEELPNGLDTIVGERGIKFSGGQRQRLAIARALYGNPDILVLDEATSALDNDTENAVMEAIESLQGEKTLIIVAHRLSTIRNCDKIYEIKNGEAILRDKVEILGE